MIFSHSGKLTLLALLAVSCGAGGPESSDGVSGAAQPTPTQDRNQSVSVGLSDLGDGYIVWETNRSGAWRLWRRDLAEDQPRQLTPDEKGRQHCCAHISPDGSQIAYLSIAGAREEYPGGTATGQLRLIAADGSNQRRVGPARVHHENRVAVWRDDRRLVYIDGDGRTVEWNRDDDSRAPVIDGAADHYGWLPDPTLSFATMGREPTFSKLRNRTVVRASELAGCQPYFTQDGRWGFWTGGGGGPIYRLALTAGGGERHPQIILGKNDPRLPQDRRYLYFPMVSRDGRFLTWGASASEHDHYKADYDVFVAEIDPDTLDLVGDPIQVTDSPATDRYADIFVEPLELGTHRGEAPLTVEWEAPSNGDWSWDFGNGETAQGAVVDHRFGAPGVYTVSASLDGKSVSGRVLVLPAQAPELLGWSLVGDGTLALDFNEPIDIKQAKVSGVGTAGTELSGDRRLLLHLTQPLEEPVTISVSGVQDLAAAANQTAPLEVEVDPALWPVERPSTLMTWTGVDGWNTLNLGDTTEALAMGRRGRAVPTARGALRTHGGWLELDPKQSIAIVDAMKHTNEFTLELVFDLQGSDGELLTWGQPSPRNTNLALFLNDGMLRMYTRVKPASRGVDPPATVAPLEPGSHHLTLAFRPGSSSIYVDGERIAQLNSFQGDLWPWRERQFRIGGSTNGAQLPLVLQGLALHRRELTPDQIGDAARRARRAFDLPKASTWTVTAQRLAATPVPSLREISPYTEALVTRRYRLQKPVDGLPDEVTVVEWGILDGATLPAPKATRRMALQRFADQPALEGLFLANDFEADTLYYTPPG